MNHSFDYQDFCEPEPSLADYSDLNRWTKWNAWDRRRTNFEYSRSYGHVRMVGDVVIYDRILKSQATRAKRSENAHRWLIIGIVNLYKTEDQWRGGMYGIGL